MLLKYSVVDNPLTADPEDKKASVRHGEPAYLEEMIDRIVFRHTTVSRSDAMAALEEFFVHFERLLLEGRSVHVPIGAFKLSIKGRFNGNDDVFDNSRHRVVANFVLDKGLKRSLQELPMEKEDYTKPAPVIKD